MTYRFLSSYDADSQSASALDAATFAAAMHPFESLINNGAPLGIAVSGGPDSMALALCLLRWQRLRGDGAINLHAFLIDHRLRPESADEAQTVQARLAALGLACDIFVWTHDAITSRVHVAARAARYGLLADACRRHGITTLALAHQAEDQAETVLERLAKGSGTDGLAGIPTQAPCPFAPDLTLIRPLLAVPKARLIALCDQEKVPFVTDPTNKAEKYARGRLRTMMPLLEAEGLTIARLLDLAARAGEDKEALALQTNAFLAQHYTLSAGGVGRLDRDPFLALPTAIAHRALDKILRDFAPLPYPIQRAKRTRLLDAIAGQTTLAAQSLNGVLLTSTLDHLFLIRESAAITDALTVKPGDNILWDHRWHVCLAADLRRPNPDSPLVLRKLGQPRRAWIDRLSPALFQIVPQSRARAALPSLWQGDRLVALPVLTSDLQAHFVNAGPLPTSS